MNITKLNALAFRYVSLGITPTLLSVYIFLSYMRTLVGVGGLRSSRRLRRSRREGSIKIRVGSRTAFAPDRALGIRDTSDGIFGVDHLLRQRSLGM